MAARNSSASAVALGGVLAGAGVMILCLGGLIPAATFVCPILCILLRSEVLRRCGSRIAWACYGCVAILGALLGPDKEASALFLFLGYYPILRPHLQKTRLRIFWKLLLFNCAVAAMYWVLLRLLGMEQIGEEYAQLGTAMTVVTLLLGNATFFLLDVLLGRTFPKRR